MRRTVSPETGRRYPLTMICAVFRMPRSTVYRATATAPAAVRVAAKRGPKTAYSDAEVVEAIHAVLDCMYAKAPATALQRMVHIHPTVAELLPTIAGELQPLD